jgi:membrane-associated protease RseP (regulator of RpoE activity)
MFDIYTSSVLVFLALLVLFFYRDRGNVERQGIFLIRKTRRGRAFLTRLGQRLPRTWWLYGMIAVAIGFAASVFITHFLLSMTLEVMAAEAAPPLAVVLPSPTSDVVVMPGLIGIPFWFWIISIFILAIVHEGSHGIMAARERVRIKSLGWGLLVAIPLAFVEPDEKQLARERPMKQLRVFAAGSFGNFVLAVATSAFLSLVFVPAFFASSGVAFGGLMEGFPAAEANLTGTIVGIDGYNVETVEDLSAALDEIGPGRSIVVRTQVASGDGFEERSFTLTTVENPDYEGSGKGFIGISEIYIEMAAKDWIPFPGMVYFIASLLSFMALLNLGIGLFNLLPIIPLDGGRMWKVVLDRYVPGQSKRIMGTLSWVLFLVILLLFTKALMMNVGLG